MKYFYFAFVFIAIVSCNFKNGISTIPEDQFIDVLIDVHLTDGILTAQGFKVNNDSLIIEKYYDHVFLKHNITPAQFKATLDLYAKSPDKLDIIYDKVLDHLTIMEGQIEENVKASNDTIRKSQD